MKSKPPWKWIVLATLGLLALLLLPVAARRQFPPTKRSLTGPALSELEFQAVRFPNRAARLELGGLLFVPRGTGPFPSVVIIQGSGASHRDNPWYLSLAAHLQRSGIVVLLPDRRGCSGSQGDWRTADFNALATDALAAADFLTTQDRVSVTGVGLVGCSQGGCVAPLAANQSGEIACVVDVVGAAVPLTNQIVYEETHNLRQLGVLPGFADLLARGTSAYLRFIAQRQFWNLVGSYDPLPQWERLQTPGLVLLGEADTNVDSAETAARLRSLHHPGLKIRVFDGSGHPLEDPPGQGDALFRADALQAISGFIHQHLALDVARRTRR